MATVIVTSGPRAGLTVDLVGELVLGRDGDVSIDDAEISGRHLSIRPVVGGVVVEDLDTKNGSWLDGERIVGAVVLRRTAVVNIGNSEIRVELAGDDATVVRPLPPELAPDRADETAVARRPAQPPPAAERSSPAGYPPAAPAPAGKLPTLVAAVVAAAVLAPLVATQVRESASSRRLSATADLSIQSRLFNSVFMAGRQEGLPSGAGSATLDLLYRSPTGRGPLSGKLVSRFDNGSLTSELELTSAAGPRSGIRLTGNGRVVSGTGKYKHASGSFRFHADQHGARRVVVQMSGNLKY